MESINLRNDFHGSGIPDKNINKFSFAFSSHLSSSDNLTVRMHSHSNDIILMQVKESLLIIIFVIDNTKSSSCKNYFSLSIVFEIVSSVETTESVSPF